MTLFPHIVEKGWTKITKVVLTFAVFVCLLTIYSDVFLIFLIDKFYSSLTYTCSSYAKTCFNLSCSNDITSWRFTHRDLEKVRSFLNISLWSFSCAALLTLNFTAVSVFSVLDFSICSTVKLFLKFLVKTECKVLFMKKTTSPAPSQ